MTPAKPKKLSVERLADIAVVRDLEWARRSLGRGVVLAFCVGVPSVNTRLSAGAPRPVNLPPPFAVELRHMITTDRKMVWFGLDASEGIAFFNTYNQPEEVARWVSAIKRKRLPGSAGE